MTVHTAIYNVLNGDATFTAYLGSTNGRKNIYTNRKITDGARPPLVQIVGPIINISDDTLRDLGEIVTYDVILTWPDTGDITEIEAAARRVRALFHKPATTLPAPSGFTQTIQTQCIGPFEVNTQSISGNRFDDIDQISRTVEVTYTLRV